MKGSQVNSMVRAKCNCEDCKQTRKDMKKIRDLEREMRERNDKS